MLHLHFLNTCLLICTEQLLLKLSELQVFSNTVEFRGVKQPQHFPGSENLNQFSHPMPSFWGVIGLVLALILDHKMHDYADFTPKDIQVVSLNMLADRIHHI